MLLYTNHPLGEFMKMYKQVTCQDGFSISIQAGSGKYCSPRNDEGPYIEVELGFPNRKELLIHSYAEDRDDPTGTVYGYVPSTIVLEMLLKHGGMNSGTIPPMIMGHSNNYLDEY